MIELRGRIIKEGNASGEALVSREPISFFGMIDMKTSKVIEEEHELYGRSIKDRILVFPHGKGSTVGSYSLYRLKNRNLAPRAIINLECEPIVAVGCIISDIPCVDRVDISKIRTGDSVKIRGDSVIIE